MKKNADKIFYNQDFRKEVIDYAQKTNSAEAARRYGLHPNSICNWLKRYREHGFEGLLNGKKSSSSSFKPKLNEELKDRIITLKSGNPRIRLHEIKQQLNLSCSLAMISQILLSARHKTQTSRQKDEIITCESLFLIKILKYSVKTYYIFTLYDLNTKAAYHGYTTELCMEAFNWFAQCFLSGSLTYKNLACNNRIYYQQLVRTLQPISQVTVINRKYNQPRINYDFLQHNVTNQPAYWLFGNWLNTALPDLIFPYNLDDYLTGRKSEITGEFSNIAVYEQSLALFNAYFMNLVKKHSFAEVLDRGNFFIRILDHYGDRPVRRFQVECHLVLASSALQNKELVYHHISSLNKLPIQDGLLLLQADLEELYWLREEKKYQQARILADAIKPRLQQLRLAVSERKYWLMIGKLCLHTDQLEAALQAFKKVLTGMRATSDQETYIDAWFNKASLYHKMKKYKISTNCCLRILNISLEQNRNNLSLMLYHLMAMNCFMTGQYDKAIEIISICRTYIDSARFSYSAGRIISLSGNIYLERKNYNEALKAFLSCAEIMEHNHFYEKAGNALFFATTAYLSLNKNELARRTLVRLKQYIIQHQLDYLLSFSEICSAIIKFRKKDQTGGINDLISTINLSSGNTDLTAYDITRHVLQLAIKYRAVEYINDFHDKMNMRFNRIKSMLNKEQIDKYDKLNNLYLGWKLSDTVPDDLEDVVFMS